MELFITVFAALFSVVNPFGSVPIFISLTPNDTQKERTHIAMMTAIYFSALLLVFFFAGSYILSFFGISLPALTIAGGLIITSSGFALLSGKFAESRSMDKEVTKEAIKNHDIAFTPMAMPMLSGPGSISLLISLYSSHPEWSDKGIIASVIVMTGIVVYFILKASPYLLKVLGQSGLKAIARIIGFLVVAIGIQYIANGVLQFLDTLK